MPHQCTNCGRTFPDGSKEMLSGCPDCGGNKFQFAPTTAAAADSSDESSDEASDAGATKAGAADPDSVTSRATETVRDWITRDDPSPPDGRDRSSADPAAQPSPDDSSAAAQSERSWPSSGEADATEADDATGDEFAEWPETARRPEDRAETEPATNDEPDGDDSERSRQHSLGSTTTLADDENSAQADARSAVVPSDDLPAHDGAAVSDPHQSADTGDPAAAPAAGDDRPPEHGRVVSEPSGGRPSIEDLREELNEQFESIKIVRPGQYELNLMELYNRDEYIISLQEDGRYVIDVPDSWHDGADDE